MSAATMSTVQRNTSDARLTAMNRETVDASASVIGDMGVPGGLSGRKFRKNMTG
jgi:hypothetical protein